MSTTQWDHAKIEALYDKPLFELIDKAYHVHKQNFDSTEIELCTLLSVKTGGCPEDCAYCPQSAHYKTYVNNEKIIDLDEVTSNAKVAKERGAKRFCIGAAWRRPSSKGLAQIIEMVKIIKSEGLEACATLGSLTAEQAVALKDAGLDFYNHNLDSSPEFYEKIISTRNYQERLDTLGEVEKAGLKVCCGGIIGMGESRHDRIGLLLQLYALPHHPTSIPINRLVPIEGTPLAEQPQIDPFEFIRTIAVTRIVFPKAMVRLAAGRVEMSEEMQALCYMAGANSIFFGETLLTAKNPSEDVDLKLLKRLGLKPSAVECETAVC